jgi:hypothetical protein
VHKNQVILALLWTHKLVVNIVIILDIVHRHKFSKHDVAETGFVLLPGNRGESRQALFKGFI